MPKMIYEKTCSNCAGAADSGSGIFKGRCLPVHLTYASNTNCVCAIVDLHIIRSHYFNAVNEGKADAIAVAKKYRLPLFCGEWGVYETAPKEEKYRWISDMIQVFDEHGIAWTMWNYDSGFGFVNSRTHQVADQRLLDILTSGKGL